MARRRQPVPGFLSHRTVRLRDAAGLRAAPGAERAPCSAGAGTGGGALGAGVAAPTRFGGGWRVTNSAYTLYTDNKVGTPDNIVVPARNVPFESFLFAAVAARAARAFREEDPGFASRLLSAAEEDFGQAALARPSPPQDPPPGGQAHSLVWKDEAAVPRPGGGRAIPSDRAKRAR